MKILSITVLIPVYNVASILEEVFSSVKKQTYPIKEIILIDNKSTDNSLAIAKKIKKENKNIDIKIVERKKTFGLSSSYNTGVKMARGTHVVTLHSDSSLPSKNELKKLITPFLQNTSVIATFPIVVHPRKIWLTYNFWQKCLFAPSVEKEIHSMNGKFDCYRKTAFLQMGGFDEEKFSHYIGTEDADMYHRLHRVGKVVATSARVVHVHGSDPKYSAENWVARRRFLAVSYARYVQMHAKDLGLSIGVFFFKPLLAFSVLLYFIHPFFLIPILAFPFFYLQKMYTEKTTLLDRRILLLPFLTIFLIYYESFWMLYSLSFKKVV